jgi:hypothetical protein
MGCCWRTPARSGVAQDAFTWADLHVRWAVTHDRSAAADLERAVLDATQEMPLWDRARSVLTYRWTLAPRHERAFGRGVARLCMALSSVVGLPCQNR